MQQVYGVLAPPSNNSYTGSVFVFVKNGLLADYSSGKRECNLKTEIK
jgi:hypothetical protein